MKQIEFIQKDIQELRQVLLTHPIYSKIKTLDDLKIFLEHHVFAVWDFMSLLKSLQQELTCVQVPWIPQGNPITRRLINEIVMGEETDVDKEGNPASHYELYVDAMRSLTANTSEVERLIEKIKQGIEISIAINELEITDSIKNFMLFSFEVIHSHKSHLVASAFTFGREDLIPDMFTSLVKDLQKSFPNQLNDLVYYLDRHIELDADEHGPMALQMISELCEEDETKWNECLEVAHKSLKVRIQLWDGILEAIKKNQLVLR
jgi:hypothetical protein